MTDVELLEKKLAFIETAVRELRRLAQLDRMASDVKERRFVEHTLQVAIQAMLDVASHIVSELRLGEPQTHGALFDALVGAGYLDASMVRPLRQMTGFRNVKVHEYVDVDLEIVKDVVVHGTDDLLRFVGSARARLSAE